MAHPTDFTWFDCLAFIIAVIAFDAILCLLSARQTGMPIIISLRATIRSRWMAIILALDAFAATMAIALYWRLATPVRWPEFVTVVAGYPLLMVGLINAMKTSTANDDPAKQSAPPASD